MYYHHISNRPSFEPPKIHTPYSRNSLGIVNTDFIWDRKREQLTLILETGQPVSKEVSAMLKGNRLILEAPLIQSYNRPYRTHLMGQDPEDEMEEGLVVIGFSELKLKYKYRYHLISCQAMDYNLIKVILAYSVWGKKDNNYAH